MKNQIMMYHSNFVWIMDFLLILACYGSELPANSSCYRLDYNEDGVINLHDLMEHLSNKPQAIYPE